MKRLMIVVLSLILSNAVFASDSAKLRMNIAGAVNKDNRYFLCVTHTGCMSMLAAKQGKAFPIDPGHIDRIIAVNTKNLRMYPQALPASCNVKLESNQTLTVSGKLVENKGNMVVNSLKCSVSS